MKEVVDEFAHIIRSARFDSESAATLKRVERCTLEFTDGSRFVAYESRTGATFKYGYQWMDAADHTIYRWDNATHFPQFDTFPYHRHVGESETAEPFPKVSLAEVLQFIASQMPGHL